MRRDKHAAGQKGVRHKARHRALGTMRSLYSEGCASGRKGQRRQKRKRQKVEALELEGLKEL